VVQHDQRPLRSGPLAAVAVEEFLAQIKTSSAAYLLGQRRILPWL